MRWHALAMGAAVLAAVPVVISPLPASAVSPMTPTEWMRYYNVSSSDVAVGTLWTDEFFPIYYTMVMNVVQMPYINGVPIDPSSYSMRAGYYLRNGVRHRGSVTLWSRRTYQNGGTSDSMPLFAGDDCSISLEVHPITGDTSRYYYVDYDVDSSAHPQVYVASPYGRRDFQYTLTAPGFSTGTFSTTVSVMFNNSYLGQITGAAPVEMPTHIDDVFGYTGYPSSRLLGNAAVMPSMPTSDLYPTITADNALDYIEDVLNPWAVQQSPDIEPYLLSEPVPAPTYPVQETWAEDADWPEGNLLPTIPAADYSVDIPEVMTEGVSFWWRCLGVLFDGLGITAIVVGLLALGIVLYFVLR